MRILPPVILLTTASAYGFEHFEARQTHPVSLTPDGALVLTLHSPANGLSVFAAGGAAQDRPVLVAEIPVGLAPVAVKARTNDEVWVVNEVSDSVSIVSLSRHAVVATLRVPDEPADVCFAAGRAFISCARSREIAVFDAVTRNSVGRIPLNGLFPRALAVSPDGTVVYAANLLSGNRTTILREEEAPAQPAPVNTALPAPPKTALIVSASDPRITWTTLDNDIAAISTASLTVTRWFTGAGTSLFNVAVHPDGGVWCTNSEALNLTRFEPELRGEFVRHRLTRFDPVSGAAAVHDLNPGIARSLTPDPSSIAHALAQPTAITFSADGTRAWIAAFNSDRVAEVDTASGAVLRRVDVRPAGQDYHAFRGPRGLCLSADGSRLYVLNKIADTLTTVDTGRATVISEQPLGSASPLPAAIRGGRGILYDARLSGNGTMSCASCHLDAETDGLAWDLGDPGGSMVYVPSAELSIHDTTLLISALHPMKGPLLTQTLRGFSLNASAVAVPAEAVVTKFHWRGDKPSIQSFNSTFPNLMGGSQIPDSDMDALAAYLMSITNHPNPNRNPDRSLKTSMAGGNAVTGRNLYNDHLKSHCIVCHQYGGGTDQNIDTPSIVNRRQPIKNPSLRLVYQRSGIFSSAAGQVNLSGFGLGSDGTRFQLPEVHPYDLDQLRTAKELADVAAFLVSFDTGTAPALGMPVTVDASTVAAAAAELALLESQAQQNACDVIATGLTGGRTRSFQFQSSASAWLSDTANEAPLSRSQLLSLLQPGDVLTFSAVLPGTGKEAIDRDLDGVLNSDESDPVVHIDPAPLRISWPGTANDWFAQFAPNPAGPWQPMLQPATSAIGQYFIIPPISGLHATFFRLRRTW